MQLILFQLLLQFILIMFLHLPQSPTKLFLHFHSFLLKLTLYKFLLQLYFFLNTISILIYQSFLVLDHFSQSLHFSRQLPIHHICLFRRRCAFIQLFPQTIKYCLQRTVFFLQRCMFHLQFTMFFLQLTVFTLELTQLSVHLLYFVLEVVLQRGQSRGVMCVLLLTRGQDVGDLLINSAQSSCSFPALLLLLGRQKLIRLHFNIKLYSHKSTTPDSPQQFIMSQLSTRPPGHPPLPSSRNLASPKTAQPFTRAPRQPHLTRTNSNSVLSRKQTSAAKPSRQHQFQIAIKYAKTPKQEQEEISFCNSQTNPHSALVRLPFEDSTDTIQKVMHYSRQKSTRGNRLGDQLVASRGKPADVLSRGSRGSRVLQKSRVDKGNEDYYVYWKAKAHEYLQSNMKLMQQNRKLTRENEQLREQLQTVSKNKIKIVEAPKISNQEETTNELRRVSKHYLGKIEAMEKELKKKQVVIGSYQQKLIQLTRQLSGDAERVKLLNKMRDQIERLQAELKQQTKDSHSATSLGNPYSTKSFKQIPVSPRRPTESRVFPT